MLKFENISFTYDEGTKALSDISLDVKKGEFIALLASNGGGKTTLLKIMLGLLTPQKGSVILHGKNISEWNRKELYGRMGLVFQNPDDQLFSATVEEDVSFGPNNMGLSGDEVKKRIKMALQSVGMEGAERKAIHSLSFGQQKRVSIAGILAMEPEILVLDEPTAGLDPKGESELMRLLSRLKQEKGITIIMATHMIDLVPLFVDRIYVLEKGGLKLAGKPETVFRNPEILDRLGLRLPYVTHLIDELKVKDNVPMEGLPLTINAARREFVKTLSLVKQPSENAVLLLGHGSREPESNREFLDFSIRYQRESRPRFNQDQPEISCAFLELCEPSIPSALSGLIKKGIKSIAAVPYFLFRAGHVKHEIPRLIRDFQREHPEVKIKYGNALWPHRNLTGLASERILEGMNDFHGSAREDTDVLIVGRGATDPEAIGQFLEAVEALKGKTPCRSLRHCFIDLAEPKYTVTLEETLSQGTGRLVVFPFYLFTGVLLKRIFLQAQEAQARHPGCDIKILPHFGSHPLMFDMLNDKIEELMAQ